MEIIAKIHTDFSEKFGIPRQSGLVPELTGKIIFESEYRNPDAVRGLELFSHIWLLWKFSKAQKSNWSATVRPPRLRGKRMGVFATRSPFRPNDIGLSCVKLDSIVYDEKLGPILFVSGVDLLDGTPIYDVKPYLPYTDAHPEASNGFAEPYIEERLDVQISEELLQKIPVCKRAALIGVLAQDPRPAYVLDETRMYGIDFAGYNVRFTVKEDTLTVIAIESSINN
ncbi:MAG: tRNA (N6-threonylcarbamoyladenosine(37)-N6)-methyltransferase TrmO [Lachnospiraceae bacterium]